MARFYECSECEAAQMVDVIDNGLPAGYADPDARCKNCGAVGSFHFAPGTARSLRESIANARLVPGPDPKALDILARLSLTSEASDPQRALLAALEEIRAKLRAEDNQIEDDVMDLMDHVVGWCAPDARIFP